MFSGNAPRLTGGEEFLVFPEGRANIFGLRRRAAPDANL
jgi:hypothetical protein